MNLFEVCVVLAVVLLLLAVLLPTIGSRRSSRINCVNNLKEVCLGAKIWSGDNGDNFPMNVSVTNGGAMELVATGNVLQTFLVMSNELSRPMILACAMDKSRTGVRDFSILTATNISYFIGIDVTNDSNPDQIIFGDCNLARAGKPATSGVLNLWTNDPVTWTSGRHPGNTGNIGLVDGSVEQTTSARLNDFLRRTGWATNRLAIP